MAISALPSQAYSFAPETDAHDLEIANGGEICIRAAQPTPREVQAVKNDEALRGVRRGIQYELESKQLETVGSGPGKRLRIQGSLTPCDLQHSDLVVEVMQVVDRPHDQLRVGIRAWTASGHFAAEIAHDPFLKAEPPMILEDPDPGFDDWPLIVTRALRRDGSLLGQRLASQIRIRSQK